MHLSRWRSASGSASLRRDCGHSPRAPSCTTSASSRSRTRSCPSPGLSNDEEYAEIKLHAERGRDLLVELGGFDDTVKRLVLGHHERLDGTGYPLGRRAADLDLETRILAVCDVYDALVSPRVYRAAWSHREAIELLGGESFDERCVAALVELTAGPLAVAV